MRLLVFQSVISKNFNNHKYDEVFIGIMEGSWLETSTVSHPVRSPNHGGIKAGRIVTVDKNKAARFACEKSELIILEREKEITIHCALDFCHGK